MSEIEHVARFVHDCRWDALPSSVQERIKMALLDDLGATLAGTLTRVSGITAAYVVEAWPGDEATILLHDQLASATGAAFANGYAANGLDIDGCALYTKGHPGAQVFPTALALGESLGIDGKRMLAAMVVGYEIAHRTARCWHDHHEVYQACASWGSVACAAVAAHLLQLAGPQIEQALGIAEYYAPNVPMMRAIDNPAMVKHGIGWGTVVGITAGQLAQRGFTGIPSLLGFEKYAPWVSDIGRDYILLDGLAWKEYACCAWVHAALDATLEMIRKYGISAAQIAHIKVEGHRGTYRLGTKPPSTTEEAQFNVAWPLAALLIDGEMGPRQVLEERLVDPEIRELARKVEVLESDEFNELYRLATLGDPRGKYACSVTITLTDGREFASGVVEAGIKFPQGWSKKQVEKKFRWLAGFVLDEARTDMLVEMIWNLEELVNVRELTALVAQR
jgi:2-methylcitrate dehydratase PrpD